MNYHTKKALLKEIQQAKNSPDPTDKTPKEWIEDLGYSVVEDTTSCVKFTIDDEVHTYWKRKKWSTGKHIVDGRGLNHLLCQLDYLYPRVRQGLPI